MGIDNIRGATVSNVKEVCVHRYIWARDGPIQFEASEAEALGRCICRRVSIYASSDRDSRRDTPDGLPEAFLFFHTEVKNELSRSLVPCGCTPIAPSHDEFLLARIAIGFLVEQLDLKANVI